MVSQLAEISKMLKLICLSLLVLVNGGFGHESGPVKGETIQQYAQRHVRVFRSNVSQLVILILS
jgi:hypothetical protein